MVRVNAVLPSTITLNNGRVTYVVNAAGYFEDAYPNVGNNDFYQWYYAINYTVGGTSHVTAGDGVYDYALTTYNGWSVSSDGLSATSAAANLNGVGVSTKVAMMRNMNFIIVGVRIQNLGASPMTNVKFYAYQDADFTNSDEGLYTTPSWGPLKFAVYENNYDGSSSSSRLSDPYYGYTFAGVSADAHQWWQWGSGMYSGQERSRTALYGDHMNGVSYYLGDGGGVARYTIGTIPGYSSVVIYWVLAITPPSLTPNQFYLQLLLGSIFARNLATPPVVIFL